MILSAPRRKSGRKNHDTHPHNRRVDNRPADLHNSLHIGKEVVMQSKRMSLAETITSTVVGLIVSFASNTFIFWALGVKIALTQNLTMVAFFTFVSLVRGYCIRRLFNSIRESEDEHATECGI